MNISDLMRGMLGNLRMTHSNVVELKVGEVVKGVVVKLLGHQEALVNVNGTVINAKLETPLNQGQVTLLQVQPESSQGVIILKPLSSSTVNISHESLVELLKQFGLKNQHAERLLIQTMHREGIPLNENNISRLVPILSQVPDRVPLLQWIQSGIMAIGRELPITPQSVPALHQLLFGRSLNQIIHTLQEQVHHWLQINQSAEGAASTSSTAHSHRLLTQLQQSLQIILPSSSIQDLPASSSSATSTTSATSAIVANSSIVADAPPSNGMGLGNEPQARELTLNQSQFQSQEHMRHADPSVVRTNPQSATQATALHLEQQQVQSTHMTSHMPTVMSGEQSVHQAESASRLAPTTDTTNQAVHYSSITQTEAAHRESDSQIQSNVQMNAIAGMAQAPSIAVEGMSSFSHIGGSWITSMLKIMGIEHEQAIAKLPLESQSEHIRSVQYESVKSILLQLGSLQDIPSGLKENAQQLLHHITGQQLLMAADRSSVFTHVTLFLPLINEEGEQTASINIQSRKGRQGEIDAENCRLLFDLNMTTLGKTLVDVHITNKIVSLQVHNNHPLLANLLEEGRQSITEALLDIGYQLSSVVSTTLPEDDLKSSIGTSTIQATTLHQTNIYSAKRYKGMDVRI